MTDVIVALEHAGFSYMAPRRRILHDVSFSLREGERVGIIGDNGSGKTTLLHALLGLHPLQEGQLLHRGKAVADKKSLRALRREVGMVFQNCDDQLFSPTVLEDVAFGLLNLGEAAETAAQKARETLAQLGVADLEQRMTHTLSGGEKRLVALATTLVMRPKALLLDEPTNDLDARGRSRIAAALAGSEIAMLLVSHDPVFLESQNPNRMLRLADARLTSADG